MRTGRKIILALCKTVLVFSIGLFAFGLIFTLTLGNENRVKGWLNDSQIYTVTTNNLQEQLRKANADTTQSDSPIITNAINSALPADKIQQFADSGLTETYKWLEGETETPQFSIDVAQIKTDFANNVAAGLTERAQTLPACNQRVRPTTSDIFTINCIPPGTNVSAEIEKVRQQILTADAEQINNEAPLSSESLVIEKNGQQQPYYQALSGLRQYYRLLKMLTIISTVLFIIAAGIIIAVSKPRYRALRTVSIPLLINGALYTIAGLLLPNQAKALLQVEKSFASNTDFGAPLKSIVNAAAIYTSGVLLKIGISFALIGVAFLATYIIIKRRLPKDSAPNPGSYLS